MRSMAAWVCLLFLGLVVFPSVGSAESMSREQGDIILEELRQIRTLLERMPRRPGSMQQVPAQQVPGTRDPSAQEKVVLKLGGDDSLGRADAPVAIVEYTDYQCFFCARFQADTYPGIRKNFIDAGTVRFIRRDLPLASHPEALKAAQAGRCAGDQGKFREMHDLLSANPSILGMDAYERFARELSLDARVFKACVDSDRHLADIRASVEGAAAIGIRSTPSFVIGTVEGDTLEGTRLTGALPYAVFEKAIRDLLKTKPAGKVNN